MNQAEALQKINKALYQLSYQVSQENAAGFFSTNRLLEDVLLPVFSLLFQAPALKNLNTLGRNSAFVDLGDENARIGIQVTSEDDSICCFSIRASDACLVAGLSSLSRGFRQS
jgi:hypothetical protein